MQSSMKLLLYQGEKHGLHTTTSSSMGPSTMTYMADWLQDRLDGKALASRHVLVDMQGQVQRSSWEKRPRE